MKDATEHFFVTHGAELFAHNGRYMLHCQRCRSAIPTPEMLAEHDDDCPSLSTTSSVCPVPSCRQRLASRTLIELHASDVHRLPVAANGNHGKIAGNSFRPFEDLRPSDAIYTFIQDSGRYRE